MWDDGRFRTDTVNDAVISRSTDNGQTWSSPTRVNPGPKNDKVNHYNVTLAVGTDGKVYVDYRQRDQSGTAPLFTPTIETYHQQSSDGGRTWTQPLLVDSVPSNAYYDAFSRDGSFEGDYNQTASVGGYTYVTRAKGRPAFDGERPALTKASDTTVALTAAGLGHQHQSNWVSLVRDAVSTPGGSVQFVPALTPGTPTTPPSVPAGNRRPDQPPKAVIKHNGLASAKARPRYASGLAKDDHQVVRVEVAIQTKRAGNRCRQLQHNLRFSRERHCGKPRVFFKATGTTHWKWRLGKRLPRGYYVLYARATDNAGQQQVDFPTRARRPFRIRK